MNRQIFTVGHSTHPLDRFLDLIERAAITAVADVRSAPFSRHSPQFNKDALAESLKERGIAYVFLGRELGARTSDPACYEGGRVQYGRLAQTEQFRSGMDRVIAGAMEHRVALLCAEKEPLECHRTLLVARGLDALGVEVVHIHADGRLEPHRDAMDRLIDVTGLPREDLFRSRDELVAEALARQEQKVAYVDRRLAADAVGET